MRYEPKVGDLLVKDETGERILVGHINLCGGVCDDCSGAPWGRYVSFEPDAVELHEGWRVERNVLEEP